MAIDGVPCSIKWVALPGDGVPVMSLSEMGDNIMLVTMFGTIRYSRERDSDELADYLVQLAAMVRKAQ